MERLFIECAVRATLIAFGTAVVLHTIGIKSPAARHTAWTSVVLTMLLLPIWTPLGPKTPIRLLPPAERPKAIETSSRSVHPDSFSLTELRPVKTSPPQPAGQNWTWQTLLLVVYGCGAFGLLARLGIGMAQTRRLRIRANLQDGKCVSSECASPITVGWLQPVVILPKHWQEWSPQQLDAVLTHEREHIRRRDPLIQWLALVNRALFWFHPLSWWLERKLSVLAEEACDTAVLARGHSPQDYSEYLLDIASAVSRSGSRLGILGMAMPGSHLRQRIPRILSSRGALPISRTRIVAAVAACAASSALLASGTLDHARAHVQPNTSAPVPSSILETAATQPEVFPPAAHVPQKPRALLAQASPPARKPGNASSPDSAEKGRQLEEAFLRNDPITEMMIAMEINYFQLNRAEYSVPLTVKISGRELVLARNGGADRTSFDFAGQIKDTFGSVIHRVRDKISIDLNGASAAQLGSAPVEYDTAFTLLPGRYSIKLLARNSETGRMGSYETAFTVPNLNKEEQGIPISSVVLSSQRVEMTDAIDQGTNMQTANPLVADGRKLIPSVTRVFSKSREMYVYLQAYPREGAHAQPLFAIATFYQGQAKALETAPIEVARSTDPKSKTIPLSLSISLADLKPGEYTCQITVSSPAARQAAVWQAPVVIEP